MNSAIVVIFVLLAILFFLWLFWGGKQYEFIGINPLIQNKRIKNSNDNNNINNNGNNDVNYSNKRTEYIQENNIDDMVCYSTNQDTDIMYNSNDIYTGNHVNANVEEIRSPEELQNDIVSQYDYVGQHEIVHGEHVVPNSYR